MLKITGYPDQYSVAPGEKIDFKISLEEGDSFDARIVRVVHGDCNPDGPGLKFRHIPTALDGKHPGRPQRVDAGSYMIVDPAPPLLSGPFTFLAKIWPTLPMRGEQTILAQWDAIEERGLRIGIAPDGGLALTIGSGPGASRTLASGKAMQPRQWYAIAVSFDPASGSATLRQEPLQRYPLIEDDSNVNLRAAFKPSTMAMPIFLAGCPEPSGHIGLHFDGKIEAPMVLTGVHPPSSHDQFNQSPLPLELSNAVIARWDFSREMESERCIDVGPFGRHGRLAHLPTRAMKGSNWTGDEHDWRRKPEHYNAIHFHHDDVYDAAWETSVSVTLPEDIKSGPYALHVSCGTSDESATREDYLAFFVRPPRHQRDRSEGPKVAFLAPTASYIAYANHGEHITARGAELQMNRLLPFGHSDLYLYDHPELGGSLYDCHADGSGVCYSSRLRPVLNFSARYHSWLGGHGSALYQYNADTHLFDWLDHKGDY